MADEWPERITGKMVWDGKETEKKGDEWTYVLNEEEIAEIEEAAKQYFEKGLPIAEVNRDNFVLPKFGKALATLKEDLLNGRGFFLVRGLPVQKYSRAQQGLIFMGIGAYLGTSRKTQNAKGHILGHVKDLTYGSTTQGIYDPESPTTRIYTTRRAQPFHVDGTDVVGLMCLQISEEGGESALMSSYAVYNHLQEKRPDIIALFRENWQWDKKGENNTGELPYVEAPIMYRNNGKQFMFISPHFIETLPRLGIEVSPERQEALQYLQSLCEAEALKMWLQIGDMQFVHNHHILHARSAYLDSPDKTRHLLRLWLKVGAEDGGWDTGSFNPALFEYNVPHVVPLEAE